MLMRAIAKSAPSATRTSCRALSTAIEPVTLPDLEYDYGALEPVISGEIMELHHSKHHQTYVNNFNALLEQYAEAEAKQDHEKMIALQPGLRFNGGGHINHSIFWTNLSPPDGEQRAPSGKLADLIDSEFGSFENFRSQFVAQTAAVQGSGWGWLGYDKSAGRVAFRACANQDPLAATGLVPLLGIDVWEHAYYLQYKNVRPDYLNAIWDIVNWSNVEERLGAALN